MKDTNFFLNVAFHRLIAEAGNPFWQQLDNLEIYLPASDLDRFGEVEYQAIARKLREQGRQITVHAPFLDLQPGSPDPEIRKVTRQRFAQMFKACAILKPLNIVMHADYEPHKYAEIFDLWLENSLETWQEVKTRATDLDLTVAFENVFEPHPSVLARLLQELDSDRFGYCCDLGHLELFSKYSLDVWLQELKDYLVELHLHDNHGVMDEHLGIGAGQIRFDCFFQKLRQLQIQPRFYTCEVYFPKIFRPSVDAIKGYL